MSVEDDLRRSLQARASDVAPDPATFARVQARIRRGRTFRLAFAGAATALAVAGIAVAAPRLIDRRIEFEPGSVATAPAPDATVSPAATDPSATPVPSDTRLVFTDGEGVYAMALDGESAETLIPSPSPCPPNAGCGMDPLRSVAAYAEGPDPDAVAVVAAFCGNLQYALDGGPAQYLDFGGQRGDACYTSTVLSPDAGHLAWIDQPLPDGEPTLHTVDWTEDGPGEDHATFGLPWAGASEVSIQDWVWDEAADGTAQGSIILRARREGVIQILRMPIERQEDGALAQTLEAPPVEARPGFVPLAFTAANTDVEYTLEARQEPDGLTDGTIVRRVGGEIDAEIAAPEDLFDGRDFNESNLWMSDAGNAVAFGDAGSGRAWYFVYPYKGEGAPPGPTPVDATVRHGALIVMRPTDTPTASDAPSTTVEVDVYFGMEGADACTANQKVTREIEGPGVARAALTELLQGPLSRESNEGISSPFTANTAGMLNDVTIADGQARVDLADFRDAVGDDSCTKSAILDALDKTLQQFATVTSTRYSFDGDAQAWEGWLGSSPESLPDFVRETSDDILAAARSRDWAALRELSGQTSCTLSDQKEPCVPYWQGLERQGEDPLGTLIDLLRGPSGQPKSPAAGMVVWPREWVEPQSDYSGPRVGIDRYGIWRYYVYSGG